MCVLAHVHLHALAGKGVHPVPREDVQGTRQVSSPAPGNVREEHGAWHCSNPSAACCRHRHTCCAPRTCHHHHHTHCAPHNCGHHHTCCAPNTCCRHHHTYCAPNTCCRHHHSPCVPGCCLSPGHIVCSSGCVRQPCIAYRTGEHNRVCQTNIGTFFTLPPLLTLCLAPLRVIDNEMTAKWAALKGLWQPGSRPAREALVGFTNLLVWYLQPVTACGWAFFFVEQKP